MRRFVDDATNLSFLLTMLLLVQTSNLSKFGDTCQTLLMLWVGVSRGPRDASFRELVHRLIICWLSLLIHDEEDEFIREHFQALCCNIYILNHISMYN